MDFPRATDWVPLQSGAAAPAFAGISRIDNIRQDVDIGTVRVNYTFGSFGGSVYGTA